MSERKPPIMKHALTLLAALLASLAALHAAD
jgi:hypothetical protein